VAQNRPHQAAEGCELNGGGGKDSKEDPVLVAIFDKIHSYMRPVAIKDEELIA
jgi:hypothetical protein